MCVAKSIETGMKLASPVCDATFGDDCLRKFADLDGIAAKHRNFEASVMIETDMVGTASVIDSYASRSEGAQFL
jgi:hypothetical protein